MSHCLRHAPTRRNPFTTASGSFDRLRNGIKSRPWWYTTLLVIGFVTIFTAIAVLFFGVNNAPARLVTSQPPASVESPAFALSLSRLVGAPVERGGTIEVLNNGDEFLPALLHAVDGARS